MAVEWFYLRAGQIVGPLTAAQLRDHAVARKVTPADHVRRGGEGDWLSATKVKGLFDTTPAVRPHPVVPPPPQPQATAREVPNPTPAPQPQPASAPRGPSVPVGWVVVGLVALVAVFGLVFLTQQGNGPRGANPSYTPSGSSYSAPSGGSSKSAKAESLRFQITQLQEEQRRMERKIEDSDAEQRREAEKFRREGEEHDAAQRRNYSPTRGVDSIGNALRYQRESEGRVRLKNSYYEDVAKVRKQISEKKKELEEAER